MERHSTLTAKRDAVLKDLKGKGVTDLDSLVERIVRADVGKSGRIDPLGLICHSEHYCIYVKME
ncbi:hypothetical protein [Mesorhizobium huakuii]|uniref:Uncharacterized protein n=1 Tax=Mesorhizobium huakuii TaxID=28104 RepID=A0ABZ0VXQ6_9HYPH|nr:hypothetical protein [Mesorhizobium huakuii]WQC01126.1 hypothetical protein U0R22_005340 [Mesorhizobium huakuii]